LPLSSTARSLSTAFEIAGAGAFVLQVAISFGVGFGLKPR
jgi:hypothetical protein